MIPAILGFPEDVPRPSKLRGCLRDLVEKGSSFSSLSRDPQVPTGSVEMKHGHTVRLVGNCRLRPACCTAVRCPCGTKKKKKKIKVSQLS